MKTGGTQNDLANQFLFLRVYISRKMPSCFQQKDYKGTFFKHQRAHVKRTSDYLYTNENHVDYISSKLKIFCLKYKGKNRNKHGAWHDKNI